MTRWLRSWHRALGVALAWLLVIIAATGAVLVYREAIIRYAVAPAVAVAQDYSPARLADDLDNIVQRYPMAGVAYLKAPSAARPYWTLVGADGSSRLVAPGTLTELGDFPRLLAVLDLLRRVHTGLILHTSGEVVVFLSGVALLFFTVSGVVMWWPSRRHFKLARMLPTQPSRQHLLISHRQIGVLFVPLLLLSTATGSIMVGNKLLHLARSAAPAVAVEQGPERECNAEGRLPAGSLLRAAATALPHATITLVHLPDCDRHSATFRMRLPGEWHSNGRTRVPVDAYSGAVGHIARADRSGPAERFMGALYPLHSSYGLPSAFGLLVFLSGAAGAWLGGTGFIAWARKRRRRSG